MKLAFFTPFNPVQSGISDYSEELLLGLDGARVDGREVDIDLFIDKGYRPSNTGVTARFGVLPARSFSASVGQYDAAIYQLGNSPAHAYIYESMLRHPGVVVMHEFVLHHLRIWMALNGGKRNEYLALMERQHGAEGKDAARRVLLGQFPEALFNFPLSEEAIERARGIIVHSRYMAGLVRGVRPDVPLAVVSMGVPLPPALDKAEARARLGIDPAAFLVTSVGHLNPYKRVSATLRAFKALLMEVPNALYLLIGSRSPNYDPARQIEMLKLSDRVRSTGYVSHADFHLYLAASDVCLNLRHPTAGETSASLLRIMGAGVPVLVSRIGWFDELPDDAVGKIDTGEVEEELLLEYMRLLAHRPDVRAAMSSAARDYVAAHHTLQGAARGYLEFVAGLDGKEHDVAVIDEGRRTKDEGEIQSANSASQARSVKDDGQAISHVSRFTFHSSDPVAIVADAAADLGITEEDTFLLEGLARSLDGLVGPRGSDGSG